MVSLINHKYSRREAHGRFASQFMLSKVLVNGGPALTFDEARRSRPVRST